MPLGETLQHHITSVLEMCPGSGVPTVTPELLFRCGNKAGI